MGLLFLENRLFSKVVGGSCTLVRSDRHRGPGAPPFLWAFLLLAVGCTDAQVSSPVDPVEPNISPASSFVDSYGRNEIPDLDGWVGTKDAGTDPGEDVFSPPISEWGQCLNPGEPGCPCAGNDECLSGYCVQTANGKQCTETCLENCPQGWACVEVNNLSTDVTYICVPQHTNLCKPCHTGADCAQLGGTGGYCLETPNGEGRFCSAPCSADDPCPTGYECTIFEGIAAESIQQCWPEDGLCECSPLALQENASTDCTVTNEFGVCTGERTCLSGGLSECTAMTPETEVCDQLDNDCDGWIDEGFADKDGDGLIDCPNPNDGFILRGYLMGDGAGVVSDGEAHLLRQSLGVTRFLHTSSGGTHMVTPELSPKDPP